MMFSETEPPADERDLDEVERAMGIPHVSPRNSTSLAVAMK